MEENGSEDRRRYARLNVRSKVNFRIKEEKEGETPAAKISGISKNISVEGICFTSETKLEPGSKLDLEIFLPSEPEPLLLMGEVRWSRPIQQEGKEMFDTGIKLYTIEKGDENRYMRYVLDKMMERLSRYLHL